MPYDELFDLLIGGSIRELNGPMKVNGSIPYGSLAPLKMQPRKIAKRKQAVVSVKTPQKTQEKSE
jgi:hypothetical protein